MLYYKNHYRKGDSLFFNLQAQFPFFYYVNNLELSNVIINRAPGRDGYDSIRCGVFSGHMYTDEDGLQHTFVAYRNYLYKDGRLTGELTQDKIYKVYDDIFDILLRYDKPQRVWLFLAHIEPSSRQFITDIFEKNGTRIKGIDLEGASIRLYDVGPEPSAREKK